MNEESVYFQSVVCLDQQDLSVWYRRSQDIQVVSEPSDDGADWGHVKRSHNLPDACWLHQAIGGKKGWQGAGRFWHIGLVEGKLWAKLPAFTYVLRVVLTNSKTLAHLRVSLPSSIQLSIRSRLTMTTYSYRCSLSLTIEHSSSRMSRAEGEREEWVRGFSRLLASAIIHCHVHAGPLVVSGICQTKNRVLLWIIAFFSQ